MRWYVQILMLAVLTGTASAAPRSVLVEEFGYPA